MHKIKPSNNTNMILLSKYYLVIIILLISLAQPFTTQNGEENNHFYFQQNAEAGYKDFRMKIDLDQETLSNGKFTFYMGNVDRENLIGMLGVSASFTWEEVVNQLHNFKNDSADYFGLLGISLDFIDGWIEIARGADSYVLSEVLGLDYSYLGNLQVSTLITTTFIFDPSIFGLFGELGLGDDTVFKMGLAIEIDYTIVNSADELTLFPLRFMQNGVVANLLKLVGFGLEVEITTPSELQIESVDSHMNHFRNLEEENINYVAAGSQIRIVKQPIWFTTNFMFGVLIVGAITSGIMRSTARKRYPEKNVKSCKKIWLLAGLLFFWPFIFGSNFIFYLFVFMGLILSGSKMSKPKSQIKGKSSSPSQLITAKNTIIPPYQYQQSPQYPSNQYYATPQPPVQYNQYYQPQPQQQMESQQYTFPRAIDYTQMNKKQLMEECTKQGLKPNWWTSDKNAIIKMLEKNDRGNN